MPGKFKPKFTLSRMGMVVIAVPFLVQIGLFLWYSSMLRTAELQESRMQRTKELVSHTNWVFGVLAAASMFCAEYAITNDKDYRASFETAINATKPEPNTLTALLQSGALRSKQKGPLDWMDQIVDNVMALRDRTKNQQEGILVRQCRAVLHLIDLMNQLVQVLQPIAAETDEHKRTEALALLSRGEIKKLWQEIVGARSEVIETDHQLYKIHAEESPMSRVKTKEWINLIVLVDIVFAFLLMLGFSKIITGRLNILNTNSQRLADGKSLLAPVSGNDEIADLDRSFHQMAEALNEAARKERAVVDNARDLICTLDLEKRFQRVNPSAQAILGWTPQTMVSQPLAGFVSEQDRARVADSFGKLASGQDIEPFELAMTTAQGGTVDMLLSAHYSPADQSFFCVMHDVTQRRQMERLKRQFLAMITHDLRSPLAAIGNTLELVSMGVYDAKSEKGQSGIKAASVNVDRMLRLISDLLEMEKFDAANLTLDLRPIEISSVIKDAVDSVKANAEQQNQTIESESIEKVIEGDHFRLVRVLVNLLSNAIKFSPPGGLVTVKVISLGEGDFVQIEVIDSGPGIPEAERDTVFEPYKQASHSQGRNPMSGTGLGLTICKSIVEAHHGKMGVAGAEPKGSTFWVKLPVKQPT